MSNNNNNNNAIVGAGRWRDRLESEGSCTKNRRCREDFRELRTGCLPEPCRTREPSGRLENQVDQRSRRLPRGISDSREEMLRRGETVDDVESYPACCSREVRLSSRPEKSSPKWQQMRLRTGLAEPRTPREPRSLPPGTPTAKHVLFLPLDWQHIGQRQSRPWHTASLYCRHVTCG